ncbi:MAG: YncE family protein [Actinomycetota bacterium]
MANFAMPNALLKWKSGRKHMDVSQEAHGAQGADTTVDAAQRRLAVGHGPIGDIAAGPRVVAISTPADGTVTLLDPHTLTERAVLTFDGEPTGVVVSDDRAYLSVSSAQQDMVAVVDVETAAVTATFPVASGITALAVGPDGKRLYAGRATGDRVEVTVIDVTAERAGTIDIGQGPAANIDALALDPRGRRLLVAVTDDRGSQLVIVDAETTRVQRVLPVGSPLRDLACAGDTVYALTSDRRVGGAVHVIDLATARVADTVVVGGAPTQLSLSRDEARAYVVDYDRVLVVCTMKLEMIDSLSAPARPSCVAHSAEGSELFLADYAGGLSVHAVESTIGMLYSQFLATDPIALPFAETARQPATV